VPLAPVPVLRQLLLDTDSRRPNVSARGSVFCVITPNMSVSPMIRFSVSTIGRRVV
jgi:hypothetical protein